MLSCKRSWARCNYGMFPATNHSCSPGLPLPASPPQDFPTTTFQPQDTARTAPITSGKKRPEMLETRQKGGVPTHPPGACVEAWRPTWGETNGIEGHLLKPGPKSQGTMPHCRAAPSAHCPADNAGMCVAWRSPSSNTKTTPAPQSVRRALACRVHCHWVSRRSTA